MSENKPATKKPLPTLQGVTLEKIVQELVAHYGFEELSYHVDINCFSHDPSVKSSLIFLRRTPWARTKVENLYLEMKRVEESNRKSGDT